ncbi:MAG: conjugal transfer protein TraH [Candidatus Micrarchaeaceae archaeon]
MSNFRRRNNMRHTFFTRIAVVLMALIFGISTSYADMGAYMGNILSQIGSLAPHAYSSQQQGYFVGGTMHVPPLGETIQPLSITLPSISNNSCGGINAMMGGFSYLNFQYLVQKLQAIIQAAPALAFEIAIKVLSEKLGGVMNGLEQITNAINGLNFNSCTAMNGIVNDVSSAITNAISGSASASSAQQANGGSDWFGNAITNFANNISQGWNSLISSITSQAGSVVNTPAGQVAMGVPTNGVLNAAASQINGGLPSDFVRTMRYYVGDVQADSISGGNGTATVIGNYDSPCAVANAREMVKNLANGLNYSISYSQLVAGQCSAIQPTQASTSLVTQIQNYLTEIYTALVNNTPITDQNAINLINMSRIPIYSFMQQAAMLHNFVATQLIQELATPIAYEVAANVSGKMVSIIGNMVSNVESDANNNLTGMNNRSYIDALNELQKSIARFGQQMSDVEFTAYSQAETVYGSFMKQYQMLNNEVQAQLSKNGNNLSNALALQRSLSP